MRFHILKKSSPIYYGPRGGRWKDPAHTIPYTDADKKPDTKIDEVDEVEADKILSSIGNALYEHQLMSVDHNGVPIKDDLGFNSYDMKEWARADTLKAKRHVLKKYKRQITESYGEDVYHSTGLSNPEHFEAKVKPYYKGRGLYLPVDGYFKGDFKAYVAIQKKYGARFDGSSKKWYVPELGLSDFDFESYRSEMADYKLKVLDPEGGFRVVRTKEQIKQAEGELTVDEALTKIKNKSIANAVVLKKIGRDKLGNDRFAFYYTYSTKLNDLFSNKIPGGVSGIVQVNAQENWRRETSDISLIEEGLEKIKAVEPNFKLYIDSGLKETQAARDRYQAELRIPIKEVQSALAPGIELFPYQNEGVRFLQKTDGNALIGDSMGLGKTLQALAYGAIEGRKLIVVNPKATRRQWVEEGKKFFPEYYDGLELTAKDLNAGRITADTLKGKNLLSINYQSLHKFESLLKEAEFDTIVVDESHRMKNPKAKVTKTIKRLAQGMPHKILLSGTAVKNKKEELFEQVNLIKPGKFSSAHQMKFATIGGLWEELRDVYIARTKEAVLKDLPDKTTAIMGYDIPNLPDYEGSVEIGEIAGIKNDIAIGKAPYTSELAKEILDSSESRILIFSDSVEATKKISEELGDAAILHHGQMSDEAREAAKKEFQKQNELGGFISPKRVFVTTRQSLAEGANMTAADQVIFNDLPWTAADILQAEDRTHRIGQKKNVNVHWITANNNQFDSAITGILQRKYDLNKKINQGKKLTEKEAKWLNEKVTLNSVLDALKGKGEPIEQPKVLKDTQVIQEAPLGVQELPVPIKKETPSPDNFETMPEVQKEGKKTFQPQGWNRAIAYEATVHGPSYYQGVITEASKIPIVASLNSVKVEYDGKEQNLQTKLKSIGAAVLKDLEAGDYGLTEEEKKLFHNNLVRDVYVASVASERARRARELYFKEKGLEEKGIGGSKELKEAYEYYRDETYGGAANRVRSLTGQATSYAARRGEAPTEGVFALAYQIKALNAKKKIKIEDVGKVDWKEKEGYTHGTVVFVYNHNKGEDSVYTTAVNISIYKQKNGKYFVDAQNMKTLDINNAEVGKLDFTLGKDKYGSLEEAKAAVEKAVREALYEGGENPAYNLLAYTDARVVGSGDKVAREQLGLFEPKLTVPVEPKAKEIPKNEEPEKEEKPKEVFTIEPRYRGVLTSASRMEVPEILKKDKSDWDYKERDHKDKFDEWVKEASSGSSESDKRELGLRAEQVVDNLMRYRNKSLPLSINKAEQKFIKMRDDYLAGKDEYLKNNPDELRSSYARYRGLVDMAIKDLETEIREHVLALPHIIQAEKIKTEIPITGIGKGLEFKQIERGGETVHIATATYVYEDEDDPMPGKKVVQLGFEVKPVYKINEDTGEKEVVDYAASSKIKIATGSVIPNNEEWDSLETLEGAKTFIEDSLQEIAELVHVPSDMDDDSDNVHGKGFNEEGIKIVAYNGKGIQGNREGGVSEGQLGIFEPRGSKNIPLEPKKVEAGRDKEEAKKRFADFKKVEAEHKREEALRGKVKDQQKKADAWVKEMGLSKEDVKVLQTEVLKDPEVARLEALYEKNIGESLSTEEVFKAQFKLQEAVFNKAQEILTRQKQTPVEPIVKRGRGRPPKPKPIMTIPAVPKKRGRPPKEKVTVEEPQEKRKRGRPPKPKMVITEPVKQEVEKPLLQDRIKNLQKELKSISEEANAFTKEVGLKRFEVQVLSEDIHKDPVISKLYEKHLANKDKPSNTEASLTDERNYLRAYLDKAREIIKQKQEKKVAPEKKKRGRPPKVRIPVVELVEPKKRGRPPIKREPVIQEKKKRGRPPKVRTPVIEETAVKKVAPERVGKDLSLMSAKKLTLNKIGSDATHDIYRVDKPLDDEDAIMVQKNLREEGYNVVIIPGKESVVKIRKGGFFHIDLRKSHEFSYTIN